MMYQLFTIQAQWMDFGQVGRQCPHLIDVKKLLEVQTFLVGRKVLDFLLLASCFWLINMPMNAGDCRYKGMSIDVSNIISIVIMFG